MDVVVLGGGGLTGRCAVRDLVASGVFEHVRVADVDGDLARAAATAAGGEPHASATVVDVRNAPAMADLLAGARVCVNAVQYSFNLTVMEACRRAGVDYLDFGGLFHMTRRQLEHDAEFRAAGRLAIPGLGQVPGISNVLARAAVEGFRSVDAIVIRDAWKDMTVGAPEVVFSWSPSTFLDEMILPAVAWVDGAYREFPAMSDPEEYTFPPPIGTVRLFRTLHSEPATLPHHLEGVRPASVEWREGGSGIEVLRLLAQLGLGGETPIPVDGTAVAPRRMLLALLRERQLLGYPPGVRVDDVEVSDVEVRGTGPAGAETRHATAIFRSKPEWGAAATEFAVGVAGSIGAILIATGKTTGTGVLPPERCVPPPELRAMLAARGIRTVISPPEPPVTSLDLT